jgi:putative lipoprotein
VAELPAEAVSRLRPLLPAIALLLAFAPSARAADPDPWFGRDKGLHFGASFTLAGGGYGGAALLTQRTDLRAATGAGLALSAGIAKEVYDRYAGGDPSWRDLTWDVVGTATGVVVAWLIDRYLF